MNFNDIFIPTRKISLMGDDFENEKKTIYRSRVEGLDDKSLLVAAPYNHGFFLPPHIGSVYEGRIATESCTYLFTVELKEYIEKPVSLWRTSLPVEINRIQMRGFVRLNIVLDIVLKDLQDSEPYKVLSKDVSASGLRILSPDPLPTGTRLNIKLPLDTEIIYCLGEVIRVIPPETEHDYYEIALKFIDLGEKSRGKIIKFIFQKQIERRKREQAFFD